MSRAKRCRFCDEGLDHICVYADGARRYGLRRYSRCASGVCVPTASPCVLKNSPPTLMQRNYIAVLAVVISTQNQYAMGFGRANLLITNCLHVTFAKIDRLLQGTRNANSMSSPQDSVSFLMLWSLNLHGAILAIFFQRSYQSSPPNRFDLRQSAARPFLAPPKRQASALIVLVAPVK